MRESNFEIRQMKPYEIDFAIGIAQEHGWNPGIYDGQPFYNTDPNGFFVAERLGELVGCISSVAYDEDYGFIGFNFVSPKHLNSGIGAALGLRALRYLDRRNIGLDCPLEKVTSYMQIGFQLNHRNLRFSGKIKSNSGLSDRIKRLRDIDFNKILDFDLICFPSKRETFLREWLSMPNAISLAYHDNSTLKGFGTIRKCFEGNRIGPLFAQSVDIAEELLLALASFHQKDVIIIDTPKANREAVDLAVKYYMHKTFETARMYSKSEPSIDIAKVFGITSFELG